MKQLFQFNKISILLIVLTFCFLYSCKKDPAPPAAIDYTNTPYTMPTLASSYRKTTSPANNPLTVEGILLGRKLFYDKKLSANGTIACASCHKQKYGFGDSTSLSTNLDGPTKRNALPLFNLGMMSAYFWDGRVTSIEDANKDALKGEQHFDFTNTYNYFNSDTSYLHLFQKAFGATATVSEDNVHKAIAQFLRTLISVDTKYDKSGTSQFTPDEQAGLALFMNNTKGDCFHCHADGPFKTFSNQFNIYSNNSLQENQRTGNTVPDNGLGKIDGNTNKNGWFRIPSLRNLAYTAPYMHDGRFQTLEQVVDFYSDSLQNNQYVDPLLQTSNQGGGHLNALEKTQLIAFLKTLTDDSFIQNPAFAKP